MADYCFVHHRSNLEGDLRPALAAAWRRKSFAPSQDLAARVTPLAIAYAARYHLPQDDLLIPRIAAGLPFDRRLWRCLVGELLAITAAEMPELPTHLESLVYLLAPDHPLPDGADRPASPLIHQALWGGRDLTFGLATYRPEYAGYNGADEVRRIAAYLQAVDATRWSSTHLAGFPGLDSDADRHEEIAFARAWLAVLTDLYTTAAANDQVLILERIF